MRLRRKVRNAHKHKLPDKIHSLEAQGRQAFRVRRRGRGLATGQGDLEIS